MRAIDFIGSEKLLNRKRDGLDFHLRSQFDPSYFMNAMHRTLFVTDDSTRHVPAGSV